MTGTAPRIARLLCFLVSAWAAAAGATPNVPLEDPVYLQLAQLRAEGKLPAYLGGARPLTEAEIRRLLEAAGVPPPRELLPGDLSGPWLRPATRVTARTAFVDEHLRPYWTGLPSEQITGVVASSCEYQQGRPCGPGTGFGLELDSSAGEGSWVSAFARLRLDVGTHAYEPGLELDRGYVNFELGPLAIEIGRDVQVLGPGVRSAMMLSENAAPLDHVRISTARPIELLGEHGSILRFTARYFVARLRDPQRFHGTLLTGSRAQLDVFDALELGGTRLLQLGGEGAPSVTLGEFVLEHFKRQSGPSRDGISNNRLSFDLAYSIRAWRGVRPYYEIAFEDVWYSPDQLFGLEVPSLTASGRHGFVIEHQRTGVISHEHSIFTTGMTNAGRTVGSPLGPDAWSIYAAVRLDLPRVMLLPWFELARFSGNRYEFADQGNRLMLVAEGPTERRTRGGARARFRASDDVLLEIGAFVERVGSADFVPGTSRTNLGGTAALTWTPGVPLVR